MPSEPIDLSDARFEHLLARTFRRVGWQIERQSRFRRHRADLFVHNGDFAYAVEIMRAPEGRRYRLIPIDGASHSPGPSGCTRGRKRGFTACSCMRAAHSGINSREKSDNSLRTLHQVSQSEYLISRASVPSQVLVLKFSTRSVSCSLRAGARPGSGKGWAIFWRQSVAAEDNAGTEMIAESMLAAPRGEYRNASQLARVSGVSVMTAFRFVRQLREEGFLHESGDSLRLVRIGHLMRRWQAANSAWREIRMRWLSPAPTPLTRYFRRCALSFRTLITRAQGVLRLLALRRLNASVPQFGYAWGFFPPLNCSDLNFVHGAPQHLYVEEAIV